MTRIVAAPRLGIAVPVVKVLPQVTAAQRLVASIDRATAPARKVQARLDRATAPARKVQARLDRATAPARKMRDNLARLLRSIPKTARAKWAAARAYVREWVSRRWFPTIGTGSLPPPARLDRQRDWSSAGGLSARNTSHGLTPATGPPARVVWFAA